MARAIHCAAPAAADGAAGAASPGEPQDPFRVGGVGAAPAGRPGRAPPPSHFAGRAPGRPRRSGARGHPALLSVIRWQDGITSWKTPWPAAPPRVPPTTRACSTFCSSAPVGCVISPLTPWGTASSRCPFGPVLEHTLRFPARPAHFD